MKGGLIREAAEFGLLYFAGALLGRVVRERADRRKALRLAQYLSRAFPINTCVEVACPESGVCLGYFEGPGPGLPTPGDSTVPPTRRFD